MTTLRPGADPHRKQVQKWLNGQVRGFINESYPSSGKIFLTQRRNLWQKAEMHKSQERRNPKKP